MSVKPDIDNIKNQIWYVSGNRIFTSVHDPIGHMISHQLAMAVVMAHNANLLVGYDPNYTHEDIINHELKNSH